jgi:hypothetical protein
MEIFAFITLLSALYPAQRVISPLVFEMRAINALWSIRTEALMLEEYLSTVTVSSLTGEVKDVGIDEVVRFSGKKKPEIIGETGEEVFHCRYLLSRITFRQSLEFRETLETRLFLYSLELQCSSGSSNRQTQNHQWSSHRPVS